MIYFNLSSPLIYEWLRSALTQSGFPVITSGRTDREHILQCRIQGSVYLTHNDGLVSKDLSPRKRISDPAADCFQRSISTETCLPSRCLAKCIYVTIFYLRYVSLSKLHSFKRKAPRWVIDIVIISFVLTMN
jgi:hypothetical protein